MTLLLESHRPKRRPKQKARLIREVCLIGDPSRRYLHIPQKGLRTEDSGLGKAEARARPIGTG